MKRKLYVHDIVYASVHTVDHIHLHLSPSPSYSPPSDPTLVRTFLATYRSFCKPTELLNLLVQRFNIPLPLDMEDPETRRDPIMMKALKNFKAVYVSPIQLRYGGELVKITCNLFDGMRQNRGGEYKASSYRIESRVFA